MERRTLLTGALGLGVLAACSRGPESTPSASPTPSPSGAPAMQGPVNLQVAGEVATGLNVPWGLVFLADDSALVSQRDSGTILRIGDGTVTEVGPVPGVRPRTGSGEGGLLGLAVPEDESAVYAYLTTELDNRVVRMSFDGGELGAPEPVLTGIPAATFHHGGRIVFDPEGHLMIATGDGEQPEKAQDLASPLGKILRVTTDGQPAPGNPDGSIVWSYGHRNVQGLAFDADGRLWASEFGAKKADELNLVATGGNHGWPDVEGDDPTGATVRPKVTWPTDECSPSGLAITRSTAFLGALQGRCVWSVPLDGEEVGEPTAWLAEEYGRIRTIAVAPDDSLWVTTSNTDGRRDPNEGDDRILRVTL